jgi:pimeloyl-ACP methyl ester carboxylesterase
MSAINTLLGRLGHVVADEELSRLAPGLNVQVTFKVDGDSIFLDFDDGKPAIRQSASGREADIVISAATAAWAQALAEPPPPRFHSFTAWQIANPVFEVQGKPLDIAQARPALERVVELVVGEAGEQTSPAERNLAQITGRYHRIEAGAQAYDVYCEHAGEGVPVLFLHTAGADGRQFLGQTSDVGLARDYRMHALDLPFHGRSLPPVNWTGSPYKLTGALYQSWCEAYIEQVVREPVIVVGCSMGAAMALVMAGERPDLLRGAIALEPPFKSPGRRNPYQNHIAVHGSLHNGAYVRGLMSPTSPIACRRRASWIYSQGGPGIYPGDLSFYSEEFDGAVVAPQVDATKVPVALLSGAYDYSATPADGARLAALIPGAEHIVMDGLGHFPMTENPDAFRGFLVRALAHIRGATASR